MGWWLGSVLSFALCMFTSSYIGASASCCWWVGGLDRKGGKSTVCIHCRGWLPFVGSVQSMSAVGGLGHSRFAYRLALCHRTIVRSLSRNVFQCHAIALGLSIVVDNVHRSSLCCYIPTKLSKWSPIWYGWDISAVLQWVQRGKWILEVDGPSLQWTGYMVCPRYQSIGTTIRLRINNPLS